MSYFRASLVDRPGMFNLNVQIYEKKASGERCIVLFITKIAAWYENDLFPSFGLLDASKRQHIFSTDESFPGLPERGNGDCPAETRKADEPFLFL